MARPIKVPRIVATTVEMNAISRLRRSASPRPGQSNGWSQASRENWFQAKLNFPWGRLKLKMIMTAIGISR
jgi:hypothetical protein